MKKTLWAFSLVFVLTQMMSCYKFDEDFWHKHNPDCRVEEITYRRETSPEFVTASFFYDHKGKPTAVNFNFLTTGRPNLLFRYDNKGRLLDFIAPYENQNYEQWYHYEYNASGRIIADSLFTFGAFIGGQPSRDASIKSAGAYEYDMHDRVKKVTRTFEYVYIADEYLYNHEGNLEIHNSYTDGYLTGTDTFHYENKVNIHRTNRIWMFIDRDYSKNNRLQAEQYNSSGLPTRYRNTGPEGYGFNFIYSIYLQYSDIKYRCK